MFIKDVFFKIYNGAGVDSITRKIRKAPCVLFYHGVASSPDPLIETESIDVVNFVKHMKYLRRFYNVISINEFEDRYNTSMWEGNEVLLTFDDGYKNMLTTALPILQEYNLPFSLFVTTNNITDNSLFPTTIARIIVLAASVKSLKLPSFDIDINLLTSNRISVQTYISTLLKTLPIEKVNILTSELLNLVSYDELASLREAYPSINPLNWNELNVLSNSPLCTVGSHCLDHICCHSSQSIREVQRQISKSKSILENNIGKHCDYFAYPNGSFTSESNSVLQEVGYKIGFSTKRLPINGLTKWNIPRLYVPYDYSRFVYSMVNYPKLIR